MNGIFEESNKTITEKTIFTTSNEYQDSDNFDMTVKCDDTCDQVCTSEDVIDGDELPAVTKLEKFVDSDIIFNRKIVARSILETLQHVTENNEELDPVITILCKLSNDPEPTVRAELMEQVPHIAVYCAQHSDYLGSIVKQLITPVIIKYLTDINNQVRKTTQASLLVILEQEVLIDQTQLEEQICPLILQLTESHHLDDHRTEAIALLCRMAPLLGKELTEKLFLHRFAALCLDTCFQIRKVCASNFGDFCQVIGSENTENVLLSKFFCLCEDGIWGVRKACAEVFMPVSCVCTMETRHNKLAQYFVNLLCDQSRWVRMSAFQALGPFISTFADVHKTRMKSECDGSECEENNADTAVIQEFSEDLASPDNDVIINDIDNDEPLIPFPNSFASGDNFSINSQTSHESCDSNEIPNEVPNDVPNEFPDEVLNEIPNKIPNEVPDKVLNEVSESSHEAELCENEEISESFPLPTEDSEPPSLNCHSLNNTDTQNSEFEFNSFAFWREPLPEVEELELDDPLDSLCDVSDENMDISKEYYNDNMMSFQVEQMSLTYSNGTLNDLSANLDDNSYSDSRGNSILSYYNDQDSYSHQHSNSIPIPKLYASPSTQDIVPCPLLDHYINMVDPCKLQLIDTEMARHCAHSFPGVVLTLGHRYWLCLKGTFESLASDMQWKVRRTLASSMHELAFILGSELTAKDLLPVYIGFLRDLDEVRAGILLNFANFLKVLTASERKKILPHLFELLRMDNDRNWRFRLLLAEQMILIADLYSPVDIKDYLLPICLLLMKDKVAEVRNVSLRLVAVIIKELSCDPDPTIARNLLCDLAQKFAQSPKWLHRQLYILICQNLIQENAIPSNHIEIYAQEIMPHLLYMAWDKVSNVRLAVARCISHYFLCHDYFNGRYSSYRDLLLQALCTLQSDEDRDVRHFAQLSPDSKLSFQMLFQ